MGILTYIKLGIIAVLVIAVGYLTYNYKHMQTVIAKQADKIDGLESGYKVLEEQQAVFKEFMTVRSKTVKKVNREADEITQSVVTGNDADLDDRLEQLWVQPDKSNPAAPGRTGRARNSPTGKAKIGASDGR